MPTYSVIVPNKYKIKKNCSTQSGYYNLDCSYLNKSDIVYIPSSSTGSWVVTKGPGNTAEHPETGDWRSGTDTDGKWKLQHYTGTVWTTVESYNIP